MFCDCRCRGSFCERHAASTSDCVARAARAPSPAASRRAGGGVAQMHAHSTRLFGRANQPRSLTRKTPGKEKKARKSTHDMGEGKGRGAKRICAAKLLHTEAAPHIAHTLSLSHTPAPPPHHHLLPPRPHRRRSLHLCSLPASSSSSTAASAPGRGPRARCRPRTPGWCGPSRTSRCPPPT